MIDTCVSMRGDLLNANSPDTDFQEFFEERGLVTVWQELQNVKKEKADTLNLREQMSHVYAEEKTEMIIDEVLDVIGKYMTNLHHVTRLKLALPNYGTPKLLPESIGNLPHLQGLSLERIPLSSLQQERRKGGGHERRKRGGHEGRKGGANKREEREADMKEEKEADMKEEKEADMKEEKEADMKEEREEPRDIWSEDTFQQFFKEQGLDTVWSTLQEARTQKVTTLNLSGTLCQVSEDVQMEVLDVIINFTSTLPHVTSLELSNNNLSVLPESMGNLIHLKRLLLRDNQLNELPKSIGNLSQLQEFDLTLNQLNMLPDSFGNLAQLQALFLTRNQLTSLPVSIYQISHLILEVDEPLQLEAAILQGRTKVVKHLLPKHALPILHLIHMQEYVDVYSSCVTSNIAFSPDGRILGMGIQETSTNNTIQVRDATTGQILQSMNWYKQGFSGHVNCVAFSPDGRILVSGSNDKTLKLWDVSTMRRLQSINWHQSRVYCVAFSQDGCWMASGGGDKLVQLWDAPTRRLSYTLKHRSAVKCVAFSPDGTTLASGSADYTIKLWDPSTGQLVHTLEGHTNGVKSVAFSRDGITLASGSSDHTINLWDPSTGQLLHTLKGHGKGVKSVAFSPDGILASGSADHTIKLWDPSTGQLLHTLKGHSNTVRCVVFSPDGCNFVSVSNDQTKFDLKLWRVQGESLLHIAVQSGEPDIVALVLEKFPKLLHSPNNEGLTPLELAQRLQVQSKQAKQFNTVVHLLTQAGTSNNCSVQ